MRRIKGKKEREKITRKKRERTDVDNMKRINGKKEREKRKR